MLTTFCFILCDERDFIQKKKPAGGLTSSRYFSRLLAGGVGFIPVCMNS